MSGSARHLRRERDDNLGDLNPMDGDNSSKSRNGRRTKTVLTDIGLVEIEVPRDRAGTSEPQAEACRVCGDAA